MACAAIVSIITLALPFCVRYITKNLLEVENPNALNDIYFMGRLMLTLLAIYTICQAFVSYKGRFDGR
jgi:ATP-binding cassette subfamily B protein